MDKASDRPLGDPGLAQVVHLHVAQTSERRAVLDRAHAGDIVGGFGRINAIDPRPTRSLRTRLAAFAAIMGPGIVVMVADNDAGGVSTYAQAGQQYGLHLVWVLVLLVPVLFVNQEMVARLGAVTGVGHARLVYERFGRWWGRFAVTDVVLLSFLTVVTEFIGIAQGFEYFGISKYIAVPLAAVGLSVVTITGSFRRWERTMFILVGLSLLAIPLVLTVRAHFGDFSATGERTVTTHLGGGVVVFVIALVGTTVAPRQLFFQQSYVVDKRLTPQWLNYERADTIVGTGLFSIGAIAVMVTCALAFNGTPLHGAFTDAGRVAHDLADLVGPWQGALFAALLLSGSVLGAGAVSLATSYAIGDVRGTRHSLHRTWRSAPAFHGCFVALICIAAAIVLIPRAPLGLVTAGVQVLAGVLLPSATVFLLLLCNDEHVLGPWTNRLWLNVVTASIVAILVALSGLLVRSTMFGDVSAPTAIAVITCSMLVAPATLLAFNNRNIRQLPQPHTTSDRTTWSMPSLERLPPPTRSAIRTASLIALRAYLASPAPS